MTEHYGQITAKENSEQGAKRDKPSFPFTAVVAQDSYKLALCLVAINPAIGGVLVYGPRGTAKSTLARGLAGVLCNTSLISQPFVTLPLGATEEMLVGTLNLQQVLQDKNVTFQKGLLAKADGGLLYVDEVNLLPDQLVDLLLDVASSGVNIVERDGISHRHSAQFILLGTMNPDEGELRPQLQDRFGLGVALDDRYNIDQRVEIVNLREQFDADPHTFIQQYADQQQSLAQDIANARDLLGKVICPQELRRIIAQRCQAANVDGMRGDIVWLRAAMAHAAFAGRLVVSHDDIAAVEDLVLNHRRQTKDEDSSPRPPFSRPPSANPRAESTKEPGDEKNPSRGQQYSAGSEDRHDNESDWGALPPQQQKTAASIPMNLDISADRLPIRTAMAVSDRQARYRLSGNTYSRLFSSHRDKKVGSGLGKKVNWFTSLLASAGRWPLKQLHFKSRHKGQDTIHLILLDTSASTLEKSLFSQAKAVIVDIAKHAYWAREQLAILGFGNQQVEVLLSKQKAPKALSHLLDTIPATGGTPLRLALQRAQQFQQQQLRQMPKVHLRTYIITDGKTTQRFDDIPLMGDIVLIDIEQSAVKRGRGERIADVLNARYLPLIN